MGTAKALLDIGGMSFIRHMIAVIRSSNIDRVIAVLGAEAERIGADLAGLDVSVVVNRNYADGQLSSILKGLEAAEEFHPMGVLICPVDHPSVSSGVYTATVEAFFRRPTSIALPTFMGRRGHPVVFPARLFDELKNAPPDVGARHVVRVHAGEVLEVETADRGILDNIDTWEDYEHLRRRL